MLGNAIFNAFETVFGLRNNQNLNYISHILCLLQPFFSSKSQSLAFRKERNDKSSNADSKKYIQCFKFMLSFKKRPQLSNVRLCFFRAEVILAHAKTWDLVR